MGDPGATEIDPLSPQYPWYTPYQFAGNKPIWAIDLDGLEEYIVTVWYKGDVYWGTTIRKIDNDKVSRKEELQPFGRSGAYYVKQQLPKNVRNREELQAHQHNPQNWARVYTTSSKEPTDKGYFSDQLESVDKGLLSLQNPGNNPLKLSHLFAGESDIGFGFDSDVLTDDNKALLNNYAYYASKLEGVKVSIECFASIEGDDDYNKDLSAKRMQAVKEYLSKKILEINPSAKVDEIINTGNANGETTNYGDNLESNRRVSVNIIIPKKKFLNHNAKNEE